MLRPFASLQCRTLRPPLNPTVGIRRGRPFLSVGTALARSDWVSVREPLADWPEFLPVFFGWGARWAAGGSASDCASAEVISAGKMVRAARRRGACKVFGLLRDGGN